MSGSVGRNDPCPCGSGKKYKKCCVASGARPAPEPGSANARAAALHELDRAVLERVLAYGTSFEDWAPEEHLPMDLEAEPAAAGLFFPWAAYEHRDDDGRSMAQYFLDDREAELSPQERAWLVAQNRARFGIWEVIETDPGSTVRVRNALTNEEHLVHERSGSEVLRHHEGILARVVAFEGLFVFCGMHPRPLGPREIAGMVRTIIKGLGGERARKLDERTLARPDFSEMLIEVWERTVDVLSNAPPPTLMTTDGEELVPTTETYALVPPTAQTAKHVREILLALPHATPDDDDIVYVRPNPPGAQLETTVIGRAQVTKGKLVMETMSRERAEHFHSAIARVCSSHIAFETREEKDPHEFFAQGPGRANTQRPSIRDRAAPPPEIAAAMRDMKAKRYAQWCDESIPALGGKTPRQAAKARSRQLREDVEFLVREIEQMESGLHPSERLDTSILRAELGLD